MTHETSKIAGDITKDVKDTGAKIQSKIVEQTADSNTAGNAADKTAEQGAGQEALGLEAAVPRC